LSPGTGSSYYHRHSHRRTIDSSSDYADITIKDNYTSLSALNLSSVNDVFADAVNGDFTIYTSLSPLATLSSTGGCIGATRWMSASSNLCNLTRGISPTCDPKAGTLSGPQGQIQKGKEVTLKAHKNFGFKFVKWTDEAGNELCDSTVYTFTLDKDMTVYAVFDTVAIYKLTINVLGGKGEYSVSATGKDGGYDYYEAGTELTITALESPIFTFLAWYTNPETVEGYEAANPLTIKMDKDITKYLEFATESYVCGWNFKKATTTNSVPATYLGDYVEEAPIITMYYTYEDRINGHNPFSGWWASKDGENSVTAGNTIPTADLKPVPPNSRLPGEAITWKPY
jgi:hypothetical protein